MSRQCPVVFTALFPLLLLVLLSGTCIASDAKDASLGRFRLTLESGESLQGRNGTMIGKYLVGETTTGDSLRVELVDIVMLERRSGTYVVEGLASGAIVGAGLLIGAIISVETDETMELDTGKIVPVGLALILGGGAIGAAIGSAFPKWEEVPLEPEAKQTALGMEFGVRLSF